MSDKINLSASVKGRYKFLVLENGKVVEERPWSDNMILNQGLDQLCNTNEVDFPSLFKVHVIGTGTADVAATDVGLGNETKRTSTYLTGTGNCGMSNVGNAVTFRRTFDHSVETGNVNYTEHGLSYTASAGNNLATRALISGGTLTVLAGQQARCVYDVVATISPSTATALTVGGTGWPVSGVTDCTGNYILCEIKQLLGEMFTDGTSQFPATLVGTILNEKNTIWGAPLNSITLPSFDSNPGATYFGIAIRYVKDSYTSGTFSFTNRPSAYSSASSFSTTGINGWGFGHNSTNPYRSIAFKYNYAQTKANTHRLRYPSITVTWARA